MRSQHGRGQLEVHGFHSEVISVWPPAPLGPMADLRTALPHLYCFIFYKTSYNSFYVNQA